MIWTAPKAKMVRKALIVAGRWKDLTDGEMPAAIRLLTTQMSAIGFETHCTILEVGVSDNDALGLDVQLHMPAPIVHTGGRRPGSDWLVSHDVYMPTLSNLSDVKIIFGFSLLTSDAALQIQKQLFQDAPCYLVNLWPFDSLRAMTVGIDQTELMYRYQLLREEMDLATGLLSLGYNCYEFYRNMLEEEDLPHIGEKHYQLAPVPYESYFTEKAHPYPDVFYPQEFQILSLYEEHFLDDAETYKPIASMLYSLGKSLNMKITWKIIGFPNGNERCFMEKLDPEVRAVIEITPPLMATDFDEAVRSSQLILVPRAAHNSRSVALTAMAMGIPTIVPTESDIHVILDQHARHLQKFMVSSMKDMQPLKFKIREVIVNRQAAVKRASDVRRRLCKASTKINDNMKEGFVQLLNPDMDEGQPVKDPFKNRFFRKNLKKTREIYEATVHVRVKGGIPQPGFDLSSANQVLFSRGREEFDTCIQQLSKIHPQLKVKYFDRQNQLFVLECHKMEALKILWQEYKKRQLTTLMERTLLSNSITEEAHAVYLTLDVSLDYEEYELGKRELSFEHTTRQRKWKRRLSGSDMSEFAELETDKEWKSRDDLHLLRSKPKRECELRKELQWLPRPVPGEQHNIYKELKMEIIRRTMLLKQDIEQLKQTGNELDAQGEAIDKEIAEVKESIEKQRVEHREKMEKIKKETEELRKEKAEQEAFLSKTKAEKEERKRLEELNVEKQKELDELREELKQKSEELEREWKEAETAPCTPIIGCRKFGEEGSELDKVNGPCGVTVNHNNEVVFADYNNHRVQILNTEYKCRHAIQLDGFTHPFKPRDVAVTADGRYFVSDDSNKQVVVCTEDNKVLATFGQNEGLNPHGLALTRDDHVLVADQNKNCIRKYTLDGKHVADIGSTGSQPGQFKSPKAVAVNSQNQMVVSDSDNNRVQVLEIDGKFVKFIGPDGSGGASESQPPAPYGVSIDEKDNIYVCDINANVIANYDSEGKFIENLGRFQVRKPSFVTIRNETPDTPTMVVTEFEQNHFKVILL